jgi:hypothetical protein
LHIPENIYIGQCLAGVEEFGVAVLERDLQFPVLAGNTFCVIHIYGSAELFGDLRELFMGKCSGRILGHECDLICKYSKR